MPYMILDAKGRATLPEDVRAALSLESGDIVILERTEHGTYELVPASIIPNDQLWFYHPEMRARIDAAESEFAAGRSTRAATPEDAEQVLDGFKDPATAAGRPARKRAR